MRRSAGGRRLHLLQGRRRPRAMAPRLRRHRTVCRPARASASPHARLHDLRHYVATRLLDAGVPVRSISERLGHASATTTLTIYAAPSQLPTAERPRSWGTCWQETTSQPLRRPDGYVEVQQISIARPPGVAERVPWAPL